jgi:hypothetical protein
MAVAMAWLRALVERLLAAHRRSRMERIRRVVEKGLCSIE